VMDELDRLFSRSYGVQDAVLDILMSMAVLMVAMCSINVLRCCFAEGCKPGA